MHYSKFNNLISLTLSISLIASSAAIAQTAPAKPLGADEEVARLAQQNDFHPDIFTQNPWLSTYNFSASTVDALFAVGGIIMGAKQQTSFKEGVNKLQAINKKVIEAQNKVAAAKHLPLHEERLQAMKGLQEEVKAMRDIQLGRTPHFHQETVTTLSENAQYQLLSRESQESISATELRIRELEASKMLTRDTAVISEYEKTIALLKTNITNIKRTDEVFSSWHKWSQSVQDIDVASQRVDQGIMLVIEKRLEEMQNAASYTKAEKVGRVEAAEEELAAYEEEFNVVSKSVFGAFGSATLRFVGWGIAVMMVVNFSDRMYQILVLNEKPSLVPIVGLPVEVVSRTVNKRP